MIRRQPAPSDPELLLPALPSPLAPPPAAPPVVERLRASVGAIQPLPRRTQLWPSPVPTYTYLAGAAGSGKTWEAKEWKEREPGIILAATTGVGAVNMGNAETINSILGYYDTASLQESYVNGFLTARLGGLWRAGVRRIIVDEVSMLAAEQLTFLVRAIEEVNGRGYVLGKWRDDDDVPPPAMGLSLVGDFLQLAPVKASYAFDSPEWPRFADTTVTLTEIRRQVDPDFITMLRAARAGQGQRVAEYFGDHAAIQNETDDHFDGSTILARNEPVDRYNGVRTAQLTGSEIEFPASRWGKQRSEWGNPDKPPQTWGIPPVLRLKRGCLVMILSNYRDPETRGLQYVNGDLGVLVGATKTGAMVQLQRTGETVEVLPVERQVKVPADGARRKELRAKGYQERIDGKWEIVGAISYTPIRVAYASTVHKSQGLSLDRVQINLRDHFWTTPGMVYVGLSRCRSMAGLRLVGSPRAISERCVCDPRLKAWL